MVSHFSSVSHSGMSYLQTYFLPQTEHNRSLKSNGDQMCSGTPQFVFRSWKRQSSWGIGLWAKADGLTHKTILHIQTAPYIWSPGVEEVTEECVKLFFFLLFLEAGDIPLSVLLLLSFYLSSYTVRQNTNTLWGYVLN